MKDRIQSIVFTLTIFTSAFLLFFVQPMYAKIIIPAFGGSASVWTTCMLFFQVTLVMGYCYAHFLPKYFSVKYQALIQITLLFFAMTFLPFETRLGEVDTANPIFDLFRSALLSIGFPFFILSTSTPLLQKWFSNTNHSRRHNPYFLYAASNLGSLLALLVYPLYFERHFGVNLQLSQWHYLYVLLSLLVLTCSYFVINSQDSVDIVLSENEEDQNPSLGQKVRWVILAFIPSSLMLGLTSYVTTDIAPVSLFWVIPLAFYLLSFVIVFAEGFIISEKVMEVIIFSSVAVLIFTFSGYFENKVLFIFINLVLFFSLSIFYHHQIAISKPTPRYLTEFYIWLSVGGMIGGVFNTLVAPLIFKLILEYWLVLAFALSSILIIRRTRDTAPSVFNREALNRFFWFLFILLIIQASMNGPASSNKILVILSLASVILLGCAVSNFLGLIRGRVLLLNISFLSIFTLFCINQDNYYLFLDRSFYSSIKVEEKLIEDNLVHVFSHGTTLHGIQIFSPPEKHTQLLAYFHSEGVVGDLIKYFIEPIDKPLNIGVIGLGCGTLSCMKRESDSMDIFEIDPLVERVARDERYFRYLEKCPANVYLGDGRITLGAQPDKIYNMLVLDAFSSDSIPTHLLTQEAINLYFAKLKVDGVVVIHISNRFLDLSKVIANFDLPKGYIPLLSTIRENSSPLFLTHQYVILVPENETSEKLITTGNWSKLVRDPNFKVWTDDFTSIIDVLKY